MTARHPGSDPALLFSTLEKAGIAASLRKTRNHGFWLRFSPHFYNTPEEINTTLDVIAEFQKNVG